MSQSIECLLGLKSKTVSVQQDKFNLFNPGLPKVKQIDYLTFVINLNQGVLGIYYIVKFSRVVCKSCFLFYSCMSPFLRFGIMLMFYRKVKEFSFICPVGNEIVWL